VSRFIGLVQRKNDEYLIKKWHVLSLICDRIIVPLVVQQQSLAKSAWYRNKCTGWEVENAAWLKKFS
jgi:hypothetical protein